MAAEVLIIEDDRGDAVLAEEYLSDTLPDVTVRWEPTLAKGLQALTPATSCVLLDLGLPDAHGTSALEEVNAAAPQVPVVVLTGVGDREAGLRAVATGAQDYLVKGEVDPETLARSLRYAVARAGNESRDLRLLAEGLRQEENRRLALGLRPQLLVEDPELRCESFYQPAGSDRLLGGDFLDAVQLPDGTLRMVLGDVAGHGPEEAAVGVALRVGWRSLVLAGYDSCDTLAQLEKLLDAERADRHCFATVCEVAVSSGRDVASICLAGHPPPVLVGDGGRRPVELRAQRPLGVPGDSLATEDVALPPGWSMLLFSDGVFEGRSGVGERSRFGLDRFAHDAERLLLRATGPGALATLVDAAETANGGPLADDVALLLCSTCP